MSYQITIGGVLCFLQRIKIPHLEYLPTDDVTRKCCKIFPGYIFGATDSWLNFMVNILVSAYLFLGTQHRNNKMIQFWCAYGYENRGYKE